MIYGYLFIISFKINIVYNVMVEVVLVIVFSKQSKEPVCDLVKGYNVQ